MTVAPPRRRLAESGLFFFGAVVVGVLLVQAAWSLVVPPFRGLDEHDHSYKAAAVARGDWSPHHVSPPDQWGGLVAVPASLVAAAHPVCADLPYTTSMNCSAASHVGDGLVTVTSSAAAYNPAFYFVVGTAGRPFSGAASLYAMRSASSLLCAVFIGLAAVATRRWANTSWPMAALLLALTPQVVYSTSITAPNGLEMASGLLLWSALLGLLRDGVSADDRRVLFALATTAIVPLAVLRSLGPLWLILILATAASLASRGQLQRLRHDPMARRAGIVVALTVAAGAAWTVIAGTNSPSTSVSQVTGSPWPELPTSWLLWVLQSIAAFPSRTEVGLPIVYALVLATWWVVGSLGWRHARGRERGVLVGMFAAACLIPAAITVMTYAEAGVAWQGRYALPYTMGLALICGWVLDRRRTAPRMTPWMLWAFGAVTAVAQVASQLHVLSKVELEPGVLATHGWIHPGWPIVVALSVAGTAILVWSFSLATSRRTPTPSTLESEFALGLD